MDLPGRRRELGCLFLALELCAHLIADGHVEGEVHGVRAGHQNTDGLRPNACLNCHLIPSLLSCNRRGPCYPVRPSVPPPTFPPAHPIPSSTPTSVLSAL